jgi:hypothetical protein
MYYKYRNIFHTSKKVLKLTGEFKQPNILHIILKAKSRHYCMNLHILTELTAAICRGQPISNGEANPRKVI